MAELFVGNCQLDLGVQTRILLVCSIMGAILFVWEIHCLLQTVARINYTLVHMAGDVNVGCIWRGAVCVCDTACSVAPANIIKKRMNCREVIFQHNSR